MALATDIRHTNAGIADRAAALWTALGQRYARHRVYRRTLNELQSLSGRELADLGMNRSMLKRLALEAAGLV